MKKLLFILTILMSTITIAQNSFDKTVIKTSDGVETVYKDGKEVVKTVYEDAKQFAPKISESVNQIAKGLKVGAESVWNILVKQQLVWSLCFLLLTIASLSNWYLFYNRNIKKIQTKEIEWVVVTRDIIGDIVNPNYNSYLAEKVEYCDDVRSKPTIKGPVGKEEYLSPKVIDESNESTIFYLFKHVHLILCLVLSYFSFIHFGDMLTGFINPEFGAMKNILDLALTLK